LNYKAYGFGSTSSIYLNKDEGVIMKVYNNKLRWSCKNHDNLKEIYNTEISIMKRIPDISSLVTYDDNKLHIRMKYFGESLYNDFTLPDDWIVQIISIFNNLSLNNIYYPEFNLNNIVVLNDKINFIDYGLAVLVDNADNTNNCNIFIKLLDMLNERYKTENDLNQRHILYNTFMNNLRIKKTYPSNVL
jgi:tRNA A-37 threonylcarbamoyl transferase component Bud32